MSGSYRAEDTGQIVWSTRYDTRSSYDDPDVGVYETEDDALRAMHLLMLEELGVWDEDEDEAASDIRALLEAGDKDSVYAAMEAWNEWKDEEWLSVEGHNVKRMVLT